MTIYSIGAEQIYQKVAEFLREGRRFALAVVMKDAGSTPRKAGTKAIIDSEGSIWGTIGGGLLESDARKMGVEAIRSGRAKIFDFRFSGSCAREDEPVCGGNMRILIDPNAAENRQEYLRAAEALRSRRRGVLMTIVRNREVPVTEVRFLEDSPPGEAVYSRVEGEITTETLAEPIAPAPLLLISGGGHVGQALARQAQLVGFDVVVVEDREEFADPRLYPGGVKTRRGEFADALAEFPIDEDTFIAIVGRGHKVDGKALAASIDSPARYIGMMGSRRKVGLVKKDFIESKIVDEEGWKRIHAPIGLDIGAQTVGEIAASIVAEMVAVRRKVGT